MAFKPLGLLAALMLTLAGALTAGPASAMDGVGGGTGGTGGSGPPPGAGQFYASLQTMLADGSEALRAALLGRAQGGEDGVRYWGYAHTESGERSPDGFAGLDERGVGVLFGLDFGLGGDWHLGAAGGFQGQSLDSDAADSSAEVETWQGGLYGGGPIGPIHAALGLGYGESKADARRSPLTGGVPDPYQARIDGDTTLAFLELSHAFPFEGATLQPFVSATSLRVRTDGFSEMGGAAALDGARGEFQAGFSELGARVVGPAHGLDVSASLAWRHVFDDETPVVALTQGSTPVSSSGVPMEGDEAVVTLGVGGDVGEVGVWRLTYDGVFGDQHEDQRLALRLSGSF